MSAPQFEIVELENGDFILRLQGQDEGEALVKISFSNQAKAYLQEHPVAVAKAMFTAGLETATDLVRHEENQESFNSEEVEMDMDKPRVLH